MLKLPFLSKLSPSLRNKFYAVLLGPILVLILYAGFLYWFATSISQENLYIFTRLFIVALVLIINYNFIFIYWMHRTLSKRAQIFLKGFQQLSEGKFSARIPMVEKEELGQIANSFNQAMERLEILDRDQKEFISQSAHQLRTPLASMRWFLEMLLSGDAGKLEPSQEEFVKKIYDQAETLIGTINKLLIIDHILTDRQVSKIKLAPIDLKELTNLAIQSCRFLMVKQKQQAQLVNPTAAAPYVTGDKDMVREVLTNLIANALQYSQPGGTVTVGFDPQESYVKVDISDTGIGIPKEAQEKIFTKFYRAENAKKFFPNGSGLGLFIAHSFISMLSGKLWFESQEGTGTTFHFTLPRVKAMMVAPVEETPRQPTIMKLAETDNTNGNGQGNGQITQVSEPVQPQNVVSQKS